MPLYVVERSLPGLANRHMAALRHAVGEASRRLTASSAPVKYLGSAFVESQSRCFCLFDALNADVVRAVNETAQLPFIAIREAKDLPSSGHAISNAGGESTRE